MRALIQSEQANMSNPALASLPSITSSLEISNRGSEPTFLRLGEQLQVLFEQAMSLEKEASAAVDMIGQSSEHSMLSDVSGLTGNCVSELREWQARISDRLGCVNDVAMRLGHLAPSSVELKKIAKRLNTINVYFAVESSRHNESANAFSAYTEELAKLVRHILDVTADIEKDSLDAQTKQTCAYDTISKGATELSQLATIAEAAMMEASEEVDDLVKFTASAMSHIGQLSSEVSRQMGKVVLALQFHDIIRQQVEHVVDALRDAQNALGISDQSSITTDSPEAIARAYSILNVQSAQLSQATTTIRNAHATIKQSFENIGEHSSELLSGVAVMDAGQMQSSELKAGLTRLTEALETLMQLLRDAEALGAQTGQAADLASRATFLLSERAERIDDINMDINTQALNAVITSVRLNEKGRTLAILAEEVTSLSVRCDKFVSTIVGDLEHINKLAADMTGGDSPQAVNIESGEADTVAMLSGVVERIYQACASYESHSLTMVQRARQIQDMVLSTGEMLDFLPRMADELQEYSVAVNEVSEALRASLPEDYTFEAAHLDDHADRYTMASERETHMRVLGTGETTERRQEDQFTSTCDMGSQDADDLGDNVDLF